MKIKLNGWIRLWLLSSVIWLSLLTWVTFDEIKIAYSAETKGFFYNLEDPIENYSDDFETKNMFFAVQNKASVNYGKTGLISKNKIGEWNFTYHNPTLSFELPRRLSQEDFNIESSKQLSTKRSKLIPTDKNYSQYKKHYWSATGALIHHKREVGRIADTFIYKGIAPLLIILVLGYSIGWVIKGFKSN